MAMFFVRERVPVQEENVSKFWQLMVSVGGVMTRDFWNALNLCLDVIFPYKSFFVELQIYGPHPEFI